LVKLASQTALQAIVSGIPYFSFLSPPSTTRTREIEHGKIQEQSVQNVPSVYLGQNGIDSFGSYSFIQTSELGGAKLVNACSRDLLTANGGLSLLTNYIAVS